MTPETPRIQRCEAKDRVRGGQGVFYSRTCGRSCYFGPDHGTAVIYDQSRSVMVGPCHADRPELRADMLLLFPEDVFDWVPVDPEAEDERALENARFRFRHTLEGREPFRAGSRRNGLIRQDGSG